MYSVVSRATNISGIIPPPPKTVRPLSVLYFNESGKEFNELFGIEMPVITLECSKCGELSVEEMPSEKLLTGYDDLEEI